MACTPAERERAARRHAARKDDPEYRAAAVARVKAWRKANPEKARVQARIHAKRRYERKYKSDPVFRAKAKWQVAKWQAANPERVREIKRESFKRHLETHRAAQAARRARKRTAFVEQVDARVVFERDEGICGICHLPVDPADWHLDHVVALAVGGKHCYANVQVAHPLCNIRKGVS